jgi:urease accessory protein
VGEPGKGARLDAQGGWVRSAGTLFISLIEKANTRLDTLSLLHGLRFIDSFFPSGGYAYSSGLEAAVQGGAVRDAGEFKEYVEDSLRGGIGMREAVAVSLACEAIKKKNLGPALKADAELEAMKIGLESRLASRQMGRQVMRIAMDRDQPHAMLRAFHQEIIESRTAGHFSVCLGLTLASNGWSRADAIAAFLYQTAVGFVSAAMKLLPVGQREGQRLLANWTPLFIELSHRIPLKTDMSAWSPIQDIYAMRHSRLESRLFRS